MTGGRYGGYIDESAIRNTNPCIKKPFSEEEFLHIIETFFAPSSKSDEE
jgi:hypothetical protein